MKKSRNKPILSYKGVEIYECFKGREALTYWYALVPRHQAERGGSSPDMAVLPSGYTPGLQLSAHSRAGWDGRVFDVRALPEQYRAGLLVEDNNKRSSDGEAFVKRYRAEREAHKEAMRRAIDDGFDLATGKRKRSGNSFFRWILSILKAGA